MKFEFPSQKQVLQACAMERGGKRDGKKRWKKEMERVMERVMSFRAAVYLLLFAKMHPQNLGEIMNSHAEFNERYNAKILASPDSPNSKSKSENTDI